MDLMRLAPRLFDTPVPEHWPEEKWNKNNACSKYKQGYGFFGTL
jgi:hypothetical protein